MPARIGGKDAASAIRATALLVWVPHLFGVLINVLSADIGMQIRTFLFAAAVFGATNFVARRFSGDVLMVLFLIVGLLSELLEISSVQSDAQFYVPRNWWLVISALQGVIAAVLCKAKDMEEGRYYEYHTVAERLYLVTPFTVGIWWGYVLSNGLAGIFSVISSVFFCLALVGYGSLFHRLLTWSGIYKMDLIGLVNHVFTTSFGIVFGSFVAIFVCVTYLAVPFMAAILELNGVLSSVGILVEIVLYDLA